MDLDLGERAKPDPLVVHERVDSPARTRRLKSQRDSGRLSAIECGECPVQDEPLEQVCWEGLRCGGPGELRAADDQEPRLCRRTREVPHRSSEQVLVPPDHVLAVHACTVVRFERNELMRSSNPGHSGDGATENCGRLTGTEESVRDIDPHDPFARFIAPFEADTVKPDHWIAGGQFVWLNTKGFAIQSGADWTSIFNNGAGHSTTVLASQNDVVWTAWCGPCNIVGFARGISTNAGGAWHQLTLPSNVPNRYVSGLAIDPADSTGGTINVGFNGFSRVWIEGPGAGTRPSLEDDRCRRHVGRRQRHPS